MPGIRNKETIWLLGSRVIGELHSTNNGHDGKGWYKRIVDVDLASGELAIYSQSHKGEGSGASNIVTGEDFYRGTDGARVSQLEASMERINLRLLYGQEVTIERTPDL